MAPTQKRIFIGPEPGNTIKVSLIGMPNSGKSSLFNALVAPPLHKLQEVSDHCFTTLDVSRGEFYVPDPRLDWYQKIFGSRGKVGCSTLIADGPALVRGSQQGAGEGMAFMEEYRECDVFLHVLRAWDDPQLTHWEETVDPQRDAELLVQELLLADLHRIEDKLLALYTEHDELLYDHQPVGKNHKWEKWTLLRAWHWLAGHDRKEYECKGKVRKHDPLPTRCEGWAIRLGEWNDMEIEVLDRLRLFTAKPMIYVLNVPLREHTRKRAEWRERLGVTLRQMELGTGFVVPLSAHLENRLADNRRAGTLERYLAANPTHQTQVPELNLQTARCLDLITFYTGKTPLSTPGFMDFVPEVNDNDVRAWRCRQGKIALYAAALVDTDLSRYYNRLTMYSEQDLRDEKGNFDRLIEYGKNRMQQKKYEMSDGDVVTFFAFDVPPDVVPKPPKGKT